MDTSQYLSMFLEESMDNLQALNESLLQLEQEPENIDKVNEIFRVAHTLKGMAATMGYSKMAELTHKMEDVLSRFRDGDLNVTQEVVTVLFTCLDKLEQMVDAISEGNEEGEIEGIIKELESLHSQSLEVPLSVDKENKGEDDKVSSIVLNEYDISVIKQVIEKEYNVYEVNITLDEKTLLKSARAFLIVKALEDSGDIIKIHPSTEDIENENFDLDFTAIYVTKKTDNEVYELIMGISEVASVNVKFLNDSFKEKLEIKPNVEVAAKPVVEKSKQPSASKSTKKKEEKKSTQHKKVHQSVRVDLERLDNFMNMVSELVIHRTRLEQIASGHRILDLSETLEQVARTTSDLQDLVMKIRMLPLDTVFNRFPRMVRDLSVELDKEMELIIEGQETELDRTVIDEIGEPLIHLIRNAADHGIESKEEREAAGKNPVGKIKLIAYQEGTKAVIKVQDDGAGINVDKIKAKAERVGISTEGMNDNDIKNLIFNQGFSTNEEVTDISGRGVGMDVVKTKIAALGGTVDLISEVGEGSSFIIRLPLTLQIIQALLVKVGSETMAISLGYVNEIVEFKEEDIKKTNNQEVIIYRGAIIPLIRINEKLDIESQNEKKGFVVIVKVGEKTAGILVDSLMGQQEIVIKPLGKILKNLKQYIGATILGDGLVTLILDIAALI
ncbi:chemotaxis protein CheA [Clostridium bornimense]|uniref:chemotaxis protein CheA n=1 Tax=Clostridium bornimense TaxID=1216932 RepID=UPI001C118342|nr:chemotaxis protein CheA [Clostridium bornimense]MBU5314681.1 chemotaxis protein CheA [Clostridium bornimense]